jgi:hypothetical protein
LRTQAASIGDELAATQAELEKSRVELERAREESRQAAIAVKAAAAIVASPPVVSGVAPSEPAIAPEPTPAPLRTEPRYSPRSSFDSARASAFRHDKVEPAEAAEKVEEAVEAEVEPQVTFRIAEDPDIVRVRAGGPVVELEASLVRGLEPVEPAENEAAAAAAKPEHTAESQAWRRTAMAELTALAGDSDDLTPNRRR